jgi:hypothetical protein
MLRRDEVDLGEAGVVGERGESEFVVRTEVEVRVTRLGLRLLPTLVRHGLVEVVHEARGVGGVGGCAEDRVVVSRLKEHLG